MFICIYMSKIFNWTLWIHIYWTYQDMQTMQAMYSCMMLLTRPIGLPRMDKDTGPLDFTRSCTASRYLMAKMFLCSGYLVVKSIVQVACSPKLPYKYIQAMEYWTMGSTWLSGLLHGQGNRTLQHFQMWYMPQIPNGLNCAHMGVQGQSGHVAQNYIHG